MNGSKYYTEAIGVVILRDGAAVGERTRSDTSRTVRNGVGAYR